MFNNCNVKKDKVLDELNGLTNEEILFQEEMKKNYINYYSSYIASNINTLYKLFGNNHNMSYQIINNISADGYLLSKEEQILFDNLIVEKLRKDYNLKLLDKENIKVEKYK